MALTLVFEAAAERDLRRQYDWLAKRSPSGAENVLGDIFASLDLLCDQPLIGAKVRGGKLRMKVTTRYRYAIIYGTEDDELRVYAIYHPRQAREF